MLPVFRPLADRAVLTVWSGLCTSTIGEDLFRVASVWLAVEVAGNMAGLVTGAQYVAMLVAGLFGAVVFDRWRPDRAMIGSRAWSAAFALLPVVGFYFSGLSITLLIISSVGLASLRMVFSPALQSTIPTLVRDRGAQQAINGLFDATYRIARLVGPMVAALLHLFMPVIHFLTVTALGFIVSGLALHAARDRLIGGQTDPVRLIARVHRHPKESDETDMPRSVETMLFLQKVDLFAELLPTELADLAAAGTWETLAAGETLEPDGLVLVATGRLGPAGPGQAIGKGALFGEPPPTPVTASERSRILRIGSADFRRTVTDNPGIALGICRSLYRRFSP